MYANGSPALETAERYDPVTKEWRPVASMNTKRSCVGVGALNGLLYAVNCDNDNKFRNRLILNSFFFFPFFLGWGIQ